MVEAVTSHAPVPIRTLRGEGLGVDEPPPRQLCTSGTYHREGRVHPVGVVPRLVADQLIGAGA